MKRSLRMTLVLLAVATLWISPAQARPQSRSFRDDYNGWIYVHIAGDPLTRGNAYGYLVAAEIDDFISTLKTYLLKTTNKGWDFYRRASDKLFKGKLDLEYKLEIEGIASGLVEAGYNYDSIDIIALNAYIELSEYYLPSIGGKFTDSMPRPLMRCSAFIATGDWTKDGNVVMGHNTWDDYITGQRKRIILDIEPDSGFRMLMQTAPGFIHSGTDFALNSAGLLITETTIGNFKGFDTKGLPEFQRARAANQYAGSLDQFVAIMSDGNNGGYANTWLIGDINTKEIGKLTLGLKNVAFFRSKDGYYDGENYVDDSKMIREEVGPTFWTTDSNWPFNLTSTNTITARRLRWYELLEKNKGRIDAELGKAFLADQIEQSTGKFNPGGFVLMARMEVSDVPEIPGAPAPRPFGANDAKVVTAELARNMSFWARMGHPDGSTFTWDKFLKQNPSYAWQALFLQNLTNNEWSLFGSRDTK